MSHESAKSLASYYYSSNHSLPFTHRVHTSGLCVTYVIIGRIRVLLFTLISTVLIDVNLQRGKNEIH